MEATKIEKGRQPYGKPSKDDPYAWATAALIQVNPSWKGDRHKENAKWFPRGTGDAPPWFEGIFSSGNLGGQLRDRLVSDIIPGITEREGFSGQGYAELVREAEKLMSGVQSSDESDELPWGPEPETPKTEAPSRRPNPFADFAPKGMDLEKAKLNAPPDLIEQYKERYGEEPSEDDRRFQQFMQEAMGAWQGEGGNLGSGGYPWDKPNMSGENVKRYWEYGQQDAPKRAYKPYEGMEKTMDLTKMGPDLARLLAAAAGWALSDDTVRSGGGSPRGERTAAQESEWAEALRRQARREEMEERRREEKRSAADRRRHERSMRRAMRTKKSVDDFPEFMKIQNFWSEKTDDYHQKTPAKGGAIAKAMDIMVDLLKDHAPVPPRQGLVWDAVKHKWVRPENHGHSVSEVQGGKRIRGHGTGVHERRVGGHGRGPIRRQQEGRRFRGVADSGTARPHEAPHPSQRYLSAKGAASPKLQRRKTVKRFK